MLKAVDLRSFIHYIVHTHYQYLILGKKRWKMNTHHSLSWRLLYIYTYFGITDYGLVQSYCRCLYAVCNTVSKIGNFIKLLLHFSFILVLKWFELNKWTLVILCSPRGRNSLARINEHAPQSRVLFILPRDYWYVNAFRNERSMTSTLLLK